MATAIQNNFSGGHAEDIRTHATNECEFSRGFDTYTNPHKLIPIRDSVDETSYPSSMNDAEIAEVGISNVVSGGVLTAVGYETDLSHKPAFYLRETDTINGQWIRNAIGLGTYARGTMVTYQEYAYVMSTDGQLQKYASKGNVSTVGTASGSSTVCTPKPFVHPEDDILYIVWGNVISRWNATTTTFDNTTTILPTGMTCTSITNYGAYLAIAMRPTNGVGNSKIYLWGRDITLNTLQGVIDCGEGALNVIENISDELVGLMYPKELFSSTLNYKVDVKLYAGGSVQTIKSIAVSTEDDILKAKKENKLYFSIGRSYCLWCLYKNKQGRWVINEDRYIYNGSTASDDKIHSVSGISFIGDYFFIGSKTDNGVYRLRATKSSLSQVQVSKYQTTINPSMPIADRYKDKQLDAIRIAYTGLKNLPQDGGKLKVSYSIDGSTMTEIIAITVDKAEGIVEVTGEDGKPFLLGQEFQFLLSSEDGLEIKELCYRYSILNSAI